MVEFASVLKPQGIDNSHAPLLNSCGYISNHFSDRFSSPDAHWLALVTVRCSRSISPIEFLV